MDYILTRLLRKLITDSLDGFFGELSEFYDERRQILKDSFPQDSPGSCKGLAIDQILGKQFAFSSASDWLELYSNPTETTILQQKQKQKTTKKDNNHIDDHPEGEPTKIIRQTLLVYLRHDLMNSKTRISASLIDKISSIPVQFVFPYAVIRLATGLWAIDNADPSLALRSLSLPSLDIGKYLHDDATTIDLVTIILSTLTIDHNPKVALQLCNMRLHENWDENFYVQHVLNVREALNLVSVAGSTCDANSQTSGRRTPSKPRTREIKKTISFDDSPAKNTRLRKGKIK